MQLLSFAAAPLGNDAVLRWVTASEQNNDRFEVESSVDGRVFRRIGQVPGQGNSAQHHSYQWVDPTIFRYAVALVYYRLRQVDREGTASYSPVQTVSVNQPVRLALFPNPTTGTVALMGATPSASVFVFDGVGRQVVATRANAAGNAAVTLPHGLPKGIYLVRVGTSALRLNVE